MKYLLVVGLGLFLVSGFVSCESKHPNETPEHEYKEPKKTDCESVVDYKVFPLTVSLWENAWATVLSDATSIPITGLTSEHLYRTFAHSEVIDFTSDQAYKDVRIYFAKQDTSDPNFALVPDLIMVHANDCVDDTLGQVLLATSTQTTLIDKAQAIDYIKSWKETKVESTEFDNYRAYTYSVAKIDSTLAGNTETLKDLRFHYAVHAKDKLRAGSSIQGFLVVDLVIGSSSGAANANNLYYDFARPCPELCAPLSPYNKAAE